MHLKADPTSKDKFGNTPFNDAVRAKHDDVVAIIKVIDQTHPAIFCWTPHLHLRLFRILWIWVLLCYNAEIRSWYLIQVARERAWRSDVSGDYLASLLYFFRGFLDKLFYYFRPHIQESSKTSSASSRMVVRRNIPKWCIVGYLGSKILFCLLPKHAERSPNLPLVLEL